MALGMMILIDIASNTFGCHMRVLSVFLGGGNSNIFYFHPDQWGMIHFDNHIFQMGWLKPPTRFSFKFPTCLYHLLIELHRPGSGNLPRWALVFCSLSSTAGVATATITDHQTEGDWSTRHLENVFVGVMEWLMEIDFQGDFVLQGYGRTWTLCIQQVGNTMFVHMYFDFSTNRLSIKTDGILWVYMMLCFVISFVFIQVCVPLIFIVFAILRDVFFLRLLHAIVFHKFPKSMKCLVIMCLCPVCANVGGHFFCQKVSWCQRCLNVGGQMLWWLLECLMNISIQLQVNDVSWFACVFFEAGIHALLFKYLDFMLQRVSSNGWFCCLLLFSLKIFNHNIQSHSMHMMVFHANSHMSHDLQLCTREVPPHIISMPAVSIPSDSLDLGSFNFVTVVFEGTSFGMIKTRISCIIDIYTQWIPKKGGLNA